MKTVISTDGREFVADTQILKVSPQELKRYNKLKAIADKAENERFNLALLYASMLLFFGAAALTGYGLLNAISTGWLFFAVLALFCNSLRPDIKGRRARRMAENEWDEMIRVHWPHINPDEVHLGVGKPGSKYLLQCAEPLPD